jgi:hypothetical protein
MVADEQLPAKPAVRRVAAIIFVLCFRSAFKSFLLK